MAQVTASPAPGDGYSGTAELIARWTAEHSDLLRGVLALREFGETGAAAVAAVLAVPTVRRFVLSVALFESMAESEGLDAAALLEAVLDAALVDLLLDIWPCGEVVAGSVEIVSAAGTAR